MGIVRRFPMASVGRDITAPPEAVWDVLVDIAAWPLWGPSVRNASLYDGASQLGLGVRGEVWTAVGVRMPFVITEFDPGRRWSWSVAGVPATGHQAGAVGPGGGVKCLPVEQIELTPVGHGRFCGAESLAAVRRTKHRPLRGDLAHHC